MNCFEFLIDTPVHYNMTGKFESPNPQWIHLRRHLSDYELMVMTRGTLYIADSKKQYAIKKGEYLLLPPYMQQYGYQPSDCSFYWLHFSYKKDVSLFDVHPESYEFQAGKLILPQQGTLKNYDKIIILMKQLQDSVKCFHDQTLNDYITSTVLCEIYNQSFCAEKSMAIKSQKQQLYNDIIDYVTWYLHSGISVSEIAKHFGYNEKYLSHMFHSVAGIPLKQYILQKNMETAKCILTDTNDTIREISEQLGFRDSHNFMKAFKKIVGLTPTQYRNAYSKRLLYYK